MSIKSNKNIGRKQGHKEAIHKKPSEDQITETKKHTLGVCPDCSNKLEAESTSQRKQITIEIQLSEEKENALKTRSQAM